ncbi:MAG TPA: PLP-dependent aminotransferase family protein [Burkholderiales bacterium]|nr:PLP-dependent aminotransferase family protein [Burkholderiales bacterium]
MNQPLYRRVQDQLIGAILRGAAPAGSRLPSLRRLAKDLGVSRITVEAAYEALQAQGLIEARARSGNYVTRHAAHAGAPREGHRGEALPWEVRLAPCANPARERMLAQVFRNAGTAGVTFAWGAGDPALFPVDAFRAIIDRILRRAGGAALGPAETQGDPALREAFAAYLRKLDLAVGADDIVVTTGSQQAIELVVGALVRPGERVIVEETTWPGALGTLEAAGADIVGVPLDEHGMRLDALERALGQGGARLIYTIPTFQNPTGTVMPAARRHELVRLARRHGVPVLEDDALREVRFGSPLPPPLATLDPSGNVIYAGSFSKSVLPAARLGYLVAPPKLRQWAVTRKRSMDMFCPPLMQRAMADYLESGQAMRFWKKISRVYAARQRTMDEALARRFPRGTRWRRVEGGPVLWVKLAGRVSVRRLFDDAVRAGVGFAPGEAFFVAPADQPYIRLNFAAVEEERIERGIQTLGALLGAANHEQEIAT